MACRRSSRTASAVAFAAAVVACGGGTPEKVASPSASAEPAPAPMEKAAKAAEEPASPEAEAPPSSEPAPETRAEYEAPREIRFVQTPEGLRVEILGVKFVPKAEAKSTPSGIGVRLTLTATTEEPRSLLAPEHGPLAFAGSIQRKGKPERETFGDDRKGEGEIVLDPAKPMTIVREWPGKNKPGGLGNGDVLELDVGLWGLGPAAAERRPVKQFLRVTVKVDRWKGRARVEPPPSMKGKE